MVTAPPAKVRGARAFLADTAFVFAAQVLTKLRGLLTMPLVIRGLGTEAFGTWSQTLAFTMLVMAVVGLNLHHSLIRFIAADRSVAGKAYGTTLFVSLASSSVFCLALGLGASPAMTDAMVGTHDQRILRLGLAIVVSSTIRSLNLNLYRATDRIKLRSVVDFAGSMLELAAIIVIVLLGYGIATVLLALALIGGAIALVTTIHGHRIAPIKWVDRALLRDALRYSAPLIPAAIAMWILDRSDRFVISRVLDQTHVGIYSAHYTIGGLIVFVLGPIQMALTPKVMQLWEKDRATAAKYVEHSFRIYVMLVLPFIAVAPLLAPALFRILANEQVAAGCSLSVLLIALGTSFWGLAVIETCGLYAARRTRAIGLVTALCAGLNFLVCVVLVPRIGTVGAAAATAIAYGFTWLAYMAVARSVWTVSRSPSSIARAVLATIPVAAFTWLVPARSFLAIALIATTALLLYVALLLLTGAITPSERKVVVAAVRRKLSPAAPAQPPAM